MSDPLTFGSLFSGIGGFDLGFERAGMVCKWQVENDEFASSVLAARWPDVARFRDVKMFCRRCFDCEPEDDDGNVWCPRCDMEFGECDCLGTDQLLDELGPVDVIVGGFPCQDLSNAGKRAGIDGERSGLWSEFLRVLCELGPRFAVVENVGSITVRGLHRVLGDLCESGFDAEWATLPASAFGAAHRRERIFIVAHSSGDGLEGGIITTQLGQKPVASLDHLHDWPAVSEPFGIRAADGISHRVDRTKCLGNAVVPHVAEWIGRRIVEFESRVKSAKELTDV